MPTPAFHYQELLELGTDDTEYRLLTKEHVSVQKFGEKEVLVVNPEALTLLATGQTDVWDVLSRRFESKLIQTALLNTRGRRIEAAVKLGIGRNTITRKIQELGLE